VLNTTTFNNISTYKHITNTAWVRAGLCKLQKNGALDLQPQVIRFTSCLPMVGGSLRHSGFFHSIKTGGVPEK
jgi:hypothetical protein